MRGWAALLGLAAALAACGGGGEGATGGGVDGGGGVDAGGTEGGSGVDGAAPPPVDAGEEAEAAGRVDAGGGDAGEPRADRPAIACEDTVGAVYATPAGMPAFDPSRRGDVVRCAPDKGYSLADAQSAVSGKGITITASSGANVYRILFRTTRGDGSAGQSSARVYLPTIAKRLPLPVIAIGHPSEGIAAGCTPSKTATSYEDLALPWAAQGYAVIVPDYAGLGTEGVQAYLDNHDQAYSLLDGARALRKMLTPGALSEKIVLFGYSQGGGAALSGQALAGTYGADGKIAAVVAFAPQWPTRMNSFGYVSMLQNPAGLTIGTGLSKSTIAVLRAYAYFGNRKGSQPGDGYPAKNRSDLANAANSLCLIPLGGYIQGVDPVLGDLFDDTLRTTLLACIASHGVGCQEPGASYFDFLSKNVLHADPKGAPVLMVQGLADQIMLPAEEAACTIDKLTAEGVTPDVCTDAIATHATVLARNVMMAIAWAESVLEGRTKPTCQTGGMPSCTP